VAELAERDQAILRLAGQALPPGEFANQIRELGLTDTTFHARLHVLMGRQDAVEAHPTTVYRLGRLTAGRRRWRLDAEEP
jgi:hypothetical protein